MTRRAIIAVISMLFLLACGGTGPASERSSIDIDQPPFLDQQQGLFPGDLIRGLPTIMAQAPTTLDTTAVAHTPRFAAMCANGSMTLYGHMRTRSFTLSFDLGLLTLADQHVLSSSPFLRSALSVFVVDGALHVTVHGQTMIWGRMRVPPARHHISITLTENGLAVLHVDGKLVAMRYGAFGTFDANMLRFGSAAGTSPGMCGAIDNLELYDNMSYDLGGGMVVEPSNPWMFKYDFDGPVKNAGRMAFDMQWRGFAGLISGY